VHPEVLYAEFYALSGDVHATVRRSNGNHCTNSPRYRGEIRVTGFTLDLDRTAAYRCHPIAGRAQLAINPICRLPGISGHPDYGNGLLREEGFDSFCERLHDE